MKPLTQIYSKSSQLAVPEKQMALVAGAGGSMEACFVPAEGGIALSMQNGHLEAGFVFPQARP